MKHVHPRLRERKGAVVNISSVQACASEAHISAYAASTAALPALTRGMASNFADAGVRVNAVCPGATRTPLFTTGLPEAAWDALERATPFGAAGKPEQVAGAILFLASPDAAYVTSTALAVDGGALSRLALP